MVSIRAPFLVAILASWVGSPEADPAAKVGAEVFRDPKSWPMFRGGPELTGVYPGTLPEELEVIWEFEADEAIEVSAAIFDGRVYFAVFEGDVICLDLETGKELWRRGFQLEGDDYKVTVTTTPCVAGGFVLFGNEDGMFFALDAKTGKDGWTFETHGEINSSPIVVEDSIFFGSYDGFVYCLKLGDGSLRWKVETEGKVHGSPGVSGDRVMIAGCDEHMRILGVADGKEIGAVPLHSPSGSSAATLGSCVYVGTHGNQVLAVDIVKKVVVWRYEHPDRQFPFVSSAAVTDKLIVIGGRDKMLHGLDPKTGKAFWTFKTRGRVESSPVIAGDRIFFGSYDGRFYELDAKTGKKKWSFDAGGGIHASPSIADGRIVIGTVDGVLYCFGRKKG